MKKETVWTYSGDRAAMAANFAIVYKALTRFTKTARGVRETVCIACSMSQAILNPNEVGYMYLLDVAGLDVNETYQKCVDLLEEYLPEEYKHR